MNFFRVGSCFLLLKRIPLLPSLTDALPKESKASCYAFRKRSLEILHVSAVQFAMTGVWHGIKRLVEFRTVDFLYRFGIILRI